LSGRQGRVVAQQFSFWPLWGRPPVCRWQGPPVPRGVGDSANRQTGGLPHRGPTGVVQVRIAGVGAPPLARGPYLSDPARVNLRQKRYLHVWSPGAWLLALGMALPCGSLDGAELDPIVVKWIEAQTNVHAWSADFVQTRRLRTLVQPLTAEGKVWFSQPNRFRWELGAPAETIAIRGETELMIVYPQLRRAERFPLGPEARGPWRDALALLEAGFPRTRAQLQAQYDVASQEAGERVCKVVLRPKSAKARKMIPSIQVEFNPADFGLLATELTLADGSRMRNDFKNQKLNPPMDAERFSAALPPGFTLTEPAARRR